MTALLHDLGATDPGLLVAVAFIAGVVVGIAFLAVCNAWDKVGGAS